MGKAAGWLFVAVCFVCLVTTAEGSTLQWLAGVSLSIAGIVTMFQLLTLIRARQAYLRKRRGPDPQQVPQP
jgi:hypothetical protein